MKNATQIDEENALQLLRNPSINFEGLPNMAVQTGNQSISQIMDEFDRAGRAILVANADQNFPETPGLRLYPDPIESIILEREVNAELMIARKRLQEDQDQAKKDLEARGEKNKKELERLQRMVQEYQNPEPPKQTTPPNGQT